MISVALCTHKRPPLLEKCLESLYRQSLNQPVEISVVDNDSNGTARGIVECFAGRENVAGVTIMYDLEPEQNIALARNRAVSHCKGEYIAFIDDDEIAHEEWLKHLHRTMVETGSDVVCGPVIPVFPPSFPVWARNKLLFSTTTRATAKSISGYNCATNNSLVRREVLFKRKGPFDPALGRTGSEDTDFFTWLDETHEVKLCWCNEAVVYETQELERSTFSWHMQREYGSGWTFARILCKTLGKLKAFFSILTLIIGGTLRASGQAFLNIHNPRAATLYMLKKICGHVGKLGYFFGRPLERYK